MMRGRAAQNAAVSPKKQYKTRAFACDEELVRSAFQSYDVSEQGLNVREALSLVSRVPVTHSVPTILTVAAILSVPSVWDSHAMPWWPLCSKGSNADLIVPRETGSDVVGEDVPNIPYVEQQAEAPDGAAGSALQYSTYATEQAAIGVMHS